MSSDGPSCEFVSELSESDRIKKLRDLLPVFTADVSDCTS